MPRHQGLVMLQLHQKAPQEHTTHMPGDVPDAATALAFAVLPIKIDLFRTET